MLYAADAKVYSAEMPGPPKLGRHCGNHKWGQAHGCIGLPLDLMCENFEAQGLNTDCAD